MAMDWSGGDGTTGRFQTDDAYQVNSDNGSWWMKGQGEGASFTDGPSYRQADWQDYQKEGLWKDLWNTNGQDNMWSRMSQPTRDYYGAQGNESKRMDQILRWAMGDQPVNQPLHNNMMNADGTSQAGQWGATWQDRLAGTGVMEDPQGYHQLQGHATAYGQHLADKDMDPADMIMPALASFFFGPMIGGAFTGAMNNESNSWGDMAKGAGKGALMGWAGGEAMGALGYGAGGLGTGLASGAPVPPSGGEEGIQYNGSTQYADAGKYANTMNDATQIDGPPVGESGNKFTMDAFEEGGPSQSTPKFSTMPQSGQTDLFGRILPSQPAMTTMADSGGSIASSSVPTTSLDLSGNPISAASALTGDGSTDQFDQQNPNDDTTNYPPGTEPVQDGGAMDMNGVNSPQNQDVLSKIQEAYSKMKDPLKMAGSLGQLYMNAQQRKQVQAAQAAQGQGFDHKKFEGLAADYMDPAKRMAMMQNTPGYKESQNYVGNSMERKLAGQGRFSQAGDKQAVSNNWAVPMLDAYGKNAMQWDNQLFGQIKDASGMNQPQQNNSMANSNMLQDLMKNDRTAYADIIGALRANQGMLPDMFKTQLS